MGKDRLGIGIIGSGFNARFHLKAFVGVRDADIRGIWSPNANNSADAANLAHSLEVGEPKLYASIGNRLPDPGIEAACLAAPNHTRAANMGGTGKAADLGGQARAGVASVTPRG